MAFVSQVGSTSVVLQGSNASSINHTHSFPSGGSNRILLAFFSFSNSSSGADVSNVKFDGVTMQEANGDHRSFASGHIFYLLESDLPSTSGNYALEASLSASDHGCTAIAVFEKAEQIAPSVTEVYKGNTGNPVSSTITTTKDDTLVIDLLTTTGGNASEFTKGTNQTVLYKQDINSSFDNASLSSTKEKATAGSTTMEWTGTSGSNYVHVLVGITAVSATPVDDSKHIHTSDEVKVDAGVDDSKHIHTADKAQVGAITVDDSKIIHTAEKTGLIYTVDESVFPHTADEVKIGAVAVHDSKVIHKADKTPVGAVVINESTHPHTAESSASIVGVDDSKVVHTSDQVGVGIVGVDDSKVIHTADIVGILARINDSKHIHTAEEVGFFGQVQDSKIVHTAESTGIPAVDVGNSVIKHTVDELFIRAFYALVDSDTSLEDYVKYVVEIDSTKIPTGNLSDDILAEGKLKDIPKISESGFEQTLIEGGDRETRFELSNGDGEFNDKDWTGYGVRLWRLEDTKKALFRGFVRQWSVGDNAGARCKDQAKLDETELLPARKITLDLFPNAPDVDLNKPVPIIVGRAKKIPCRLINDDDVNREFDYLLGEGVGLNNNNFKGVFTAYDEDRATSEITGDVQAGSSTTTINLESADKRFDNFYQYQWFELIDVDGSTVLDIKDITSSDQDNNTVTVSSALSQDPNGLKYRIREWRFYDGSQVSPHAGFAFLRFKEKFGETGQLRRVYADVDGLQDEKNFVRFVESVLTNSTWGLGLSVNTTSFNNASAISEISAIKVEWAILENTDSEELIRTLLETRDAVLTNDNNIKIEVDQAGTSTLTLGLHDGFEENIIEVGAMEYQSLENRVKELTVKYRQNYKEGSYLGSQTATVNEKGKVEELILPHIYEHASANRVLYYKQQKMLSQVKTLPVIAGKDAKDLEIGDVVTLDIPDRNISTDWKVLSNDKDENRYQLRLYPYKSAVYSYSQIGTLPNSPSTAIAPDYTQTEPNDISSLNTTAGHEQDDQGNNVGFIDVSVTPPNDGNYLHTEFYYKKNGDPVSNYKLGTTAVESGRITGLVTGLTYDILARPKNKHGLTGNSLVDTNILITGDTTPPNVPPTPSLELKFRTFTARITGYSPPADIDKIEFAFTDSGGTIKKRKTVTADDGQTDYEESITADGTSSITRRCKVRARDKSKNWSNYSSLSSSKSTAQIVTEDVQNNDISGKFTAQSTGGTSLSIGSWTNIESIFVASDQGQPLYVWASFVFHSNRSSGTGSGNVRLRRGSSVIRQTTLQSLSPNQSALVALQVDDQPNIGGYTYYLDVFAGNSDMEAQDPAIMVSEWKR